MKKVGKPRRHGMGGKNNVERDTICDDYDSRKGSRAEGAERRRSREGGEVIEGGSTIIVLMMA